MFIYIINNIHLFVKDVLIEVRLIVRFRDGVTRPGPSGSPKLLCLRRSVSFFGTDSPLEEYKFSVLDQFKVQICCISIQPY